MPLPEKEDMSACAAADRAAEAAEAHENSPRTGGSGETEAASLEETTTSEKTPTPAATTGGWLPPQILVL